jgi:hypothetical protein
VTNSLEFISEPCVAQKSCHSTKIGEKPVIRIYKFLCHSDTDPYFYTDLDLGPDPSIKKPKNYKKTMISAVLWLFNALLSLKIKVNGPEVRNNNKQKNFEKKTYFF